MGGCFSKKTSALKSHSNNNQSFSNGAVFYEAKNNTTYVSEPVISPMVMNKNPIILTSQKIFNDREEKRKANAVKYVHDENDRPSDNDKGDGGESYSFDRTII